MSGGKLIIFAIGIIFLTGIIVNLTVSPVYDVEDITPEGILLPFINLIEDGWSFNLPLLGDRTIHIASWFWLGNETIENYIIDQLTYISLLPEIISIPLIILTLISFILGIVLIVKDIIPFT